ncbi:hypothetical protein [Cohaesibacter haloalkalitolerans]|uniref:hypothetical protein n=1 Tax=Cohaesibacter haloalkalitolerans TaxID=1162980 RepID=UPI000E6469C1|nr:hypothetical protein [Cohaesibacter haloalkalitolerans]
MTQSETVSAGLDGITGSARAGCSPLDLIQKVFPIRSLLHVGTGLKRAFDVYRDLAVPSVVFVETGGADLGRLSNALGDRAGYSLHQAWLTDIAGDAVCYSASNIKESGLIKPESLASLWQNLKTRSEMPVETVTLDQFVDASVAPEAASVMNWIVIDQLQAGAVAKGGRSLIARCDVVVARLVLVDNLLPEASGFSKTEFDALMADFGLAHVVTEPEVNPAVARCFYVRDWKQQLQSELGAFKAQAKDRQVALEGELSNLREALRAAAARSAEEISRLVSERDEKAALATKRAEHVQHLTRARDEQTALVKTNENEVKRLTRVLNMKPPMFNFKGIRRLERLADTSKSPKVYVEVKSLPRSGLHYLRNSLEHILGPSFSFCEWYHEPGCCRNMPCDLTGIMENDDRPHLRLIKSHDFDLLDPPYSVNGSSIRRLILVREPLYILTSWWGLEVIQANAQMLAKNNINVTKIFFMHEKAVVADAFALIEREGVLPKEEGLEAWLKEKQSYIAGFVDKWCNPKEPLGDVVSYGDGKQHVLRLLEPFVETMSEQSRHMLDEFKEGSLDAFRPRKSAFDGPTECVSRFLHDHAKAFEAAAAELGGTPGGTDGVK